VGVSLVLDTMEVPTPMSRKVDHDGDQFCLDGEDGEHCPHWHEGSDCCFCQGGEEVCTHEDNEGSY